jgi:hypothetical protein
MQRRLVRLPRCTAKGQATRPVDTPIGACITVFTATVNYDFGGNESIHKSNEVQHLASAYTPITLYNVSEWETVCYANSALTDTYPVTRNGLAGWQKIFTLTCKRTENATVNIQAV